VIPSGAAILISFPVLREQIITNLRFGELQLRSYGDALPHPGCH
jgi:hypothetical protein